MVKYEGSICSYNKTKPTRKIVNHYKGTIFPPYVCPCLTQMQPPLWLDTPEKMRFGSWVCSVPDACGSQSWLYSTFGGDLRKKKKKTRYPDLILRRFWFCGPPQWPVNCIFKTAQLMQIYIKDWELFSLEVLLVQRCQKGPEETDPCPFSSFALSFSSILLVH